MSFNKHMGTKIQGNYNLNEFSPLCITFTKKKHTHTHMNVKDTATNICHGTILAPVRAVTDPSLIHHTI